MTIKTLTFWILVVVLATLSFDFEATGLTVVSALQKGVLLVSLLCTGYLARGIKVWLNVPNLLLILGASLALCFNNVAFSGQEVLTSARAFVLLFACTAILRGSMEVGVQRQLTILHLIQWLPLTCVVIGLLLIPFGFAFGRIEGGVYRVAGASSPAHIAMLCCASVAASSLISLIKPRASSPLALLASLAILVLSGSRTALIVAVVIGLPALRSVLRVRTAGRLVLVATGLIVAPATIYLGVQRLLARSIDQNGDLVTSGRDAAWSFFYERFLEAPIFGHGLGSVLEMRLLSSDYRVQFFHVPHNEYLRFMVDLGIVGMLLVLVSQGLLFYQAVRSAPFKKFAAGVALAHAGFAYVDNVYGTLQYLPYLMVLGIAASSKILDDGRGIRRVPSLVPVKA